MKYYLVGYGSLISHDSLKETIGDKKFIPVIIKGYKRKFNVEVHEGKYYDVLDVIKSEEDNFNGVLFSVDEDELKKIRERESEYKLEKSWAYDFKTGTKLFKCIFFSDFLFSIEKDKRKLDKDYFVLCREAAYAISKQFGSYWDNTTYTKNDEKISSWLKKNPEYDTLKIKKKV